jgi:hypothetical protein
MCASRYLITGPLLTLVILLSACVFQQNQVDGTYPSLCAADNAPSDEGNTQRMPNYCGGVVPGNGTHAGNDRRSSYGPTFGEADDPESE